MSKIYGIDLGTTYSCVCYIDANGLPQIVGDIQSTELLTPSVVMFEENERDDEIVIVGSHAKEYAKLDPERVIDTVKRHMHNSSKTFVVDGRNYSPVDISAKILKHLTDSATQKLGIPVTDVVITVPAYFGALERDRTMQAGKQAGLNVHDIITEPMAAALHYGLEEEIGKTILVYDLGGGTFDVAIMRIEENFHKRVLAVRGDHDLGGVLWDNAISEYWVKQIAESSAFLEGNILADRATMASIRLEAEKAKQRLSGAMLVSKHVLAFEGKAYPVSIDRDSFDDLTSGLLERTITLVDEALDIVKQKLAASNQNMLPLKIDKIIMVGGSSLMKQVGERIKRRFGDSVELLLDNPHFAVAYGAAQYAAYLTEKPETIEELRTFVKQMFPEQFASLDSSSIDIETLPHETVVAFAAEAGMSLPKLMSLVKSRFTDVCPKSFGIMHVTDASSGYFVTNLIRTQQEMPAKGSKMFATVQSGQRVVTLNCVENERNLGIEDEPVGYNAEELIGTAEIELEPGMPEGAPIEVTIEFTPTGLVRVHGRDMTHGREAVGEFRSRATG